MAKKPFKETGFGKFINEQLRPIAGKALEAVGDLTGREGLERIGELIQGKVDAGGDDALQFKALQLEFETRKMEFQHELDLLAAEAKLIELDNAEMANVRSREIEYVKATGSRDWLMGVVVIVSLIMYIGAFVFISFGPVVPDEKKDLFNMAFGQVFTFAGMVFAYYLGTTRGSRNKDEALKRAIK